MSKMGADFLFAVGPYSRIQLDVPGDYGLWLLPDDLADSADLVTRVEHALMTTNDVMTNVVGLPQLEHLEIVKARGDRTYGKGLKGLVLLECGPNRTVSLDSLDWVLTHELQHQWFPGSTDLDIRTGLWLSEGMATYFHCWYHDGGWPPYSYVRGETSITWPVHSIDEVSQGTAPVSGEERQVIIYVRGAWVAHMLRRIIGDEPFFRTLQRFYGLKTTRLVGMTEFSAIAEEESGTELDAFFHDWLKTPSIPHMVLEDLRVSWADSGLRIAGTVVNTVPMELPPVRIAVMAGTERVAVQEIRLVNSLSEPEEQTGRFEITAHSLTDRLVLDPDSDLIDHAAKDQAISLIRVLLVQPGTLIILGGLATIIGGGVVYALRRRASLLSRKVAGAAKAEERFP